jgi:hypothetical protein
MSLLMMAKKTASVQRASIVGGKRGAPVEVLAGLQCTPLTPADPGTINAILQRTGASSAPYRMHDTFVLGEQAIFAGDTLVMDGESYQVRAAANWAPGRPCSRAFTHLTVEEIPA